MAWRKLYDRILNPDGPGYVVGASAEGRRVRITVEEEVSECCEKWRDVKVARTLPHGSTMFDLKPKFCPECGRKL